MDNDQTCEMLGIGKIKLKLHDETICSVIEVWDVQCLKKNHVLDGFLLESKGFKSCIENGTLKVLYRAILVVMTVTCQ